MPLREGGALRVSTKLMILQLIVVAGVCAFLFFFGLGSLGLLGADEPRYAQIGREMLQRHDWVVPTLNGAPWLEKPVLLYWMEMISYRLYGVHDWAARIPSAMFASGLVLAIYFFMRRFRSGSEMDAALITASMAGVLGFARGASTDMPISAPLCVAMLAWWAWNETERKMWLGAFYALLGLGALAKGPVAPAFAVLIVGTYAVLQREGKIFFRSLWTPGFALFAAITLPWYIAVQNRVPQFFHTFFIEHNLERFGTNLYRHAQPFWYYIPVFLLAVMPWTVLAVPAMAAAVRDLIKRIRNAGEDEAPQLAPAAQDDGLVIFLVLWILIPIVFFSISRSKLPGYILPAVPPAGILTAAYLQRLKKVPRPMLMLHSLVCGGILAAALLVPWLMLKQPVPPATRNIIVVSAGVIAIVVLLLVRWRGLQGLHFVTVLPVVLGITFLLHPSVASLIDQVQSARPVDARLRQLGAGDGPILALDVKREVVYGLNFYRNQPILRYEDGIPTDQHVLVTRQGNGDAVHALLGDRQVSSLGVFAPQRLEFFQVAKSK
jgi:4-amino-4-deoxy-L-arabinose transferase-like glycosyltransferase